MVKGLWSQIKPQEGKLTYGEIVSLTELGNKHFKETGKDLVIVTDHSILSWLYIKGYNGLDWKLNGDYAVLSQALHKFFTQMKNAHVSFVFFFNLLEDSAKEQIKIKVAHETFVKIGKSIDDPTQEKPEITPFPTFGVAELCCFVEAEGYPFFSVADKTTIYAYGRKNNVYGALVNETDTLANNMVFLSADSLDVTGDDVKCTQFKPEDVAKHLKISVNHFPIFGALVGNEITYGVDEIDKFRAKLKKEPETEDKKPSTLLCVAEFLSGFEPTATIDEIIQKAEIKTPAAKNAILKGCAFYNSTLTPEQDKEACLAEMNSVLPFKLAETLYNSVYDLHNIYNIVKNKCFMLPANREHYPRDFLGDPGLVLVGNSVPVNTITLPLRKRMYSFLNYQNNDEDTTDMITEEGPVGEKFEKKSTNYELCSSKVKSALQGRTRVRAELFMASMNSENLNNEIIETSVQSLLYTSLSYILHYHAPIMFDWEFNALLKTVDAVIKGKTATDKKVEKVTARGLYVLSVFENVVYHAIYMGALLHVFPKDKFPLPHEIIDASLFHINYDDARNGLQCAKLTSELEKLKDSLIAGDDVHWLEKKERSPPYTIHVRNIDADETDEAIKQLFEIYEPKSVNFDIRRVRAQIEAEKAAAAAAAATEGDSKTTEETPAAENKGATEGATAEKAESEEDPKRTYTYVFVEFNTLADYCRAFSGLNGQKFGRFNLEVYPADNHSGSQRKEHKDREGFETVQSKRAKEMRKKKVSQREPQAEEDGKKQRPKQKSRKVSEESAFMALQKAHQKEIETVRKSKKVTTKNAFAALEETDE